MPGVSTAEKVIVPAAGDTFDYLGEIRRLANSLRTPVAVANRAEADVIAAAMATDGRPVSDTNPLYVFRTDNERVEMKNASGWGGPPQGIVAYSDMTTASGAIAAKAIVLNIPTYTFKAGRTYRIKVEGNYYVTSTGSTFMFGLATCPVSESAPSTANMTQIAFRTDNPNVSSEGRRLDVSVLYRPGTSGALQLKFFCERQTGGASAVVSGATDNPVQFYIEDMGVTQGGV